MCQGWGGGCNTLPEQGQLPKGRCATLSSPVSPSHAAQWGQEVCFPTAGTCRLQTGLAKGPSPQQIVFYWLQEINNKMREMHSMGSMCRVLTKGFPFSGLNSTFMVLTFTYGSTCSVLGFFAQMPSYSFLPYSISATQPGQPGLPSHNISALSSLSRSGLHLPPPQVS